ncbi:hypothetical protein [Lentibacillus kapialis]|nr:hypothetical protein [Lentibacillus kapialis]
MVGGPLLVSILPGIVVLLLIWWLRKWNLPLLARMTPGILAIIAAVVLFYIGFVNIRGFEGGAYGILAFFLMCFAIVSLIMAKQPVSDK